MPPETAEAPEDQMAKAEGVLLPRVGRREKATSPAWQKSASKRPRLLVAAEEHFARAEAELAFSPEHRAFETAL